MVSIRPLQSIIANLTKNVDIKVGLIIDNNESLHNYHLKPNKIRQLYHSEMVIIIDRKFEIFLDKVLNNLDPKKQQVIEVAKLPGIKLLESHNEHSHHNHDEDNHHHHTDIYDYHLWLDVDKVKIIAKELTKLLINKNSAYSIQYNQNLKDFINKLDELDKEIKDKVISLKGKNFIVTHNAYQYFINRYGLNQPKSVTIDHDHNIGAKSFLELQHSIKNNEVKCIFEEPQFESRIMQKLKENSQVKIGKLDAEWGDASASLEDSYFVMMNNLAGSFATCLK